MFAVGSISVRGGFLRRETAREVVYVKSSTRIEQSDWSETLKYGIRMIIYYLHSQL